MSIYKRTMVFIDGENITIGYQSLVGKGWQPIGNIAHESDVYVWTSSIWDSDSNDIVRLSYYTSVFGDDPRLDGVRSALKRFTYRSYTPHGTVHQNVVPRVFKKTYKDKKAKSVDINICIDMLNHAGNGDVDEMTLITGDGDYVPLVETLMRHGIRVIVAAFENVGLSERLRLTNDEFCGLERYFFSKGPT